MKLKVLGSSSKGNCYILDNDEEALVIECGIPFQQVKQAVNFDISRIVGAIVSHEHGDHAKHVKSFLKNRIPVYMSVGTATKIQSDANGLKPTACFAGEQFRIGTFDVIPFDVEHDAEEPLGFLIKHNETGVILFATDTYFVKYKFDGLNNMLVECNYRQDLLDANTQREFLKARTMTSHMSFEGCKNLLKANDLSRVNNIVLIHLSDANSNAEEFKRDMQNELGRAVQIASSGMEIKFNKSPF